MVRLNPLLWTALLACGGASPAPQTTAREHTGTVAQPCAGHEEVHGGAPEAGPHPSFADWQSWTKVTAKPFVSKGHGKAWVDVYVKPAFVAHYGPSLHGAMPVGMSLVKVAYMGPDAAAVKNLTAMVKQPGGYDPENGDWYYGVFDATGTKAMNEGKIEACINCHDQADETDYVFGVPEKHR